MWYVHMVCGQRRVGVTIGDKSETFDHNSFVLIKQHQIYNVALIL